MDNSSPDRQTTFLSLNPFGTLAYTDSSADVLGTFSDYRQLAYKGRPRVLSTARFWRPLWRALRFFISTYKFLLSVTPTPLVSTSCAPHSPGRILVKLIRAQRAG